MQTEKVCLHSNCLDNIGVLIWPLDALLPAFRIAKSLSLVHNLYKGYYWFALITYRANY